MSEEDGLFAATAIGVMLRILQERFSDKEIKRFFSQKKITEILKVLNAGAVMDEQRPLGLESLAKRSGDRTPRGIFSVVSQRGFERC